MADNVETFTRFGATVDTMTEAFTFVMEYMDKAGPNPSVSIDACYSDQENTFNHYHVAVFGVVNPIVT